MLSDIARADVVDLDRWSLKVTRTPVPGAGGSTEDVSSNGGGGKVRGMLLLTSEKCRFVFLFVEQVGAHTSDVSLEKSIAKKTVAVLEKNHPQTKHNKCLVHCC